MQNNKSLEEVAEQYLKALVDRNLLSITRTMYDGRAECYSMHDLLRDLCVRKAEEEKFLCVFKHGNISISRRGSVHQFPEDALDHSENLSCCRSLIFTKTFLLTNISSILPSLRLVRVFDVREIYFNYFPIEILKLANLRFLAIFFRGSLPSAIWRLRNLQTLLVNFANATTDRDMILPYEAWEISGLRHIIINNADICIDFKIRRVHENLQTIRGVRLRDLLASNLINNIPNIKELKIDSSEFVSEDRIIDLCHLHKLETLELESFRAAPVLSIIELPNRLKQLYLFRCTLPMGFVNGAGDLQYLRVLKISGCEFQSEELNIVEEWELNEGVEFCSLQLLELNHLDIKRWKADYSHFPTLRHLRIHQCKELEEIPACIAEMSTLEKIEVDKDNRSHIDWANEVQKIQQTIMVTKPCKSVSKISLYTASKLLSEGQFTS